MEVKKINASITGMREGYVSPICEVVEFVNEGVLCQSGLDMKGSTQDIYEDDVIILS